MKWYEISVYTSDLGTELVSYVLSEAGITQLSIDMSRESCMAFLRESAVYWDYADPKTVGSDTPCVKGYLACVPENEPLLEAARQSVAKLCASDLGFDAGPLLFTVHTVDEEDWANEWKRYYKPLNVGERLLILPSWEPCPPTERRVLKLDPGMAFGTGEHQTTRMCLEFLDAVIRGGETVLDLGCGSGILSIGALVLGAKNAVCVDIDPIATKVAAENAALNELYSPEYRVFTGDVLKDEALRQSISGKYPVVLANIVADVIIALTPFAMDCLEDGGVYIVSGIIDERGDELETYLQKQGLALLCRCESGGWCAFMCKKQ